LHADWAEPGRPGSFRMCGIAGTMPGLFRRSILMIADPYPSGTVDWTGENPVMYLKDDPDGDWASLLCFFRVTWSPHGVGHACVVLQDPSGTRADANLCLTDNEPMARYLVEGFMAHFAAFRGRELVRTLPYRPLTAVSRGAHTGTRYAECISAPGMAVELVWDRLGAPYAVDMPPSLTATGRHQMYSVIVDSDEAWCTVNGRRLPGRVMPRPVAGRESRSAFLAFSETWILK
jgi:hypothetical protein